MARDEVLAVALELERLAVILADEVAQMRFREANCSAELRIERPLELLWHCVNHVIRRGRTRRRMRRCAARRLVRLGVRREGRVEKGRGRGIDGAREEHQPLSEYIGGEAEDSVPVDAGMLEVDARSTVGTDNDL